MAGKLNLTIRRGDTYRRTFTWRNSAGVPYDLTGYTARMQFRTTPDGAAVVTFENSYFTFDGPNGEVSMEIPEDETAAYTWSKLYYDLEIRNTAVSPDFVKTLIAGEVRCIKDITRP